MAKNKTTSPTDADEKLKDLREADESDLAPKDHNHRKSGSVSKDELKSFFDRIKILKEERKQSYRDYGDDIKEVLREAEAKGYHKKALNQVVDKAIKGENKSKKRLEVEDIVDNYECTLGILPLFESAEQ